MHFVRDAAACFASDPLVSFGLAFSIYGDKFFRRRPQVSAVCILQGWTMQER